MSLASVRQFFADRAPDIEVLVTETSSATVAEAAATHGVEPGRIAKTLSLRVSDRTFLVVTSGTARLDHRKVKAPFGGRASMLGGAEAEAITGHPVGGVCPFGLIAPLPVYLDISLKAFDEVVPAAGARNSAVRIKTSRMAELVDAHWVDVCTEPSVSP